MQNWRFAAADTHLYPGARLRCLETPSAAVLRAGDRMLIEFSDGCLASARIGRVAAAGATVTVESYRTARGTSVAARSWEVAPGTRPGELRVKARAR